jgi:hypothetical protein
VRCNRGGEGPGYDGEKNVEKAKAGFLWGAALIVED